MNNNQIAIDKVKMYFNKYKQLERRFYKTLAHLEEVREHAKNTPAYDYTRPHITTGALKDPTENTAAQILQLEELTQKRLYKAIDHKLKLIDLIELLEDEEEKFLLLLRYLDGYTWERVAEAMKITRRQAHLMNNKALLNIAIKIIDNNKQKAEKQQGGITPLAYHAPSSAFPLHK